MNRFGGFVSFSLPLALPLACTTLLACAAPGAHGGDDDVGAVTEAVQYAPLGEHYAYVQEDTLVARSTGSIQAPFRDSRGAPLYRHGSPVRGTCGITFISPHYAVTAAHCVDSGQVPNPQTDKVTVEQYDIQDASPFALALASQVTGRFPDFERYLPVEEMPTYHVDSFECTVRARCSYGKVGCGFDPDTSADIALIHCPERTSRDYMPIAASDPTRGPVEMYWAHEVLDIPNERPTRPSSTDANAVANYYDLLDLYEHYTVYSSSDRGNNYHYLGGGRNGLLPLRSTPWPASQGGGERRRLGGSDRVGGTVRTDLFACHGTSGSGVFQRNDAGNLEFLGPVSRGATWANDRLCNNPETFDPGETGLTYTASASTRRLAQDFASTLRADRLQRAWVMRRMVFAR